MEGMDQISQGQLQSLACPSHRKDMVCIWPGQPDGEKESGTKPMLALLKNANKRLASNGVSRRSR